MLLRAEEAKHRLETLGEGEVGEYTQKRQVEIFFKVLCFIFNLIMNLAFIIYPCFNMKMKCYYLIVGS